jgi:hypothetical protein
MPKPISSFFERLARSNADGRKLGAYLLLVVFHGRELQREVEELEEVRLHELLVDFRKVDGRGGRRRRLLEIARQRLRLVARLHRLHAVEVVRTE